MRMIEVSTLDTLIGDAITAMGTGDWSTARTKLIAARTALLGIPDTEFGGSNGTKIRQDRADRIAELIQECTKQESADLTTAYGAVQYTRVTRAVVSG